VVERDRELGDWPAARAKRPSPAKALFDQSFLSVEVDIVVAARGILDAAFRLAGPTRIRKLLASIFAEMPGVAEPGLFDRTAPTSNQSEGIAENG
jgi:hypothetical protein